MHPKREEILFGPKFPDCPSVELTEREVRELLKITTQIDQIVTDETLKLTANQASIGFLGEYAVAKYYNLEFNILKEQSDGGYDFYVYHVPSEEHGTIDVKTRDFGGADLLVPERHELTADAYMLVEKRGSCFGLKGTAKASEVAKAEIKTCEEGFKVPTRFICANNLTEVPSKRSLISG